MGKLCNKQTIIAKIFSLALQTIFSGENEWEWGSKQDKGRGEIEELKPKGPERRHYRKNPKRVAPPPYSSTIVHLLEYDIPCRRFHIGAVIFIEAASGSAVMAPNLKSFSHFQVKCKSTLVFVAHRCNHRWLFPIDCRLTMLFMSRYARMLPIFQFNSSPS